MVQKAMDRVAADAAEAKRRGIPLHKLPPEARSYARRYDRPRYLGKLIRPRARRLKIPYR
jgi:hypothetical protein